MLFIGTKKQAQDPVRSYAEKCGMSYVNERWLGGMLTNFETIAKRVSKMQEYERMRISGEFDSMPKKEALLLGRELEKLQKNLGGIRNMSKRPDAVFILDTKKEHIAVTEANKLKIPVIAVVDTNVDPDVVQFPIPGQRRRHPRQRPDEPGHRRGDRRGSLHRQQAQPAGRRSAEAHGGGRSGVRRLAGRRPPSGCCCPGRARRPRRLVGLAGRRPDDAPPTPTQHPPRPQTEPQLSRHRCRRRSRRGTPTSEAPTAAEARCSRCRRRPTLTTETETEG